jgi:drug/metabolite transporter (DMT)-like permease
LTVLSTVCATLWMSTYQPQLSAARASLIYFLEPVFATAFSIAFGFDTLSVQLFLGGVLILTGNLLVELPLWLRATPLNR